MKYELERKPRKKREGVREIRKREESRFRVRERLNFHLEHAPLFQSPGSLLPRLRSILLIHLFAVIRSIHGFVPLAGGQGTRLQTTQVLHRTASATHRRVARR